MGIATILPKISIKSLPDEALQNIISYLPVSDLLKFELGLDQPDRERINEILRNEWMRRLILEYGKILIAEGVKDLKGKSLIQIKNIYSECFKKTKMKAALVKK